MEINKVDNFDALLNNSQGFIQDFFLGGEHLCAGKLISCGHTPQGPRGVWGHAPPEKF